MFTELLFLLVFKISSLCTIAIALSANYRIINGATVRWPYARYQVSVRWEYLDWTFGWGHQCGGALIASNIVLTAAHCVWNGFYDQPLEPEDILVVLGGLNRYVKDENTLVLGVKDIIVGADFHSKFLTDDIAVLILNNTVSVDFKAAAIIEMNYKPEVISGTKCIVTGWGIMNNKSYPEELQFIEVPIIAKTKCLELYGPKIFKEGMLCAGYIKGDRDACTGDSGGPLVCDNKLVGIVSAGLGCAKPDYPGIYTDVAFYAARVTNALESHRIENDLTKLLNGNLSFNIHVNTSAASLFFFTSKHYFTLLYLLIACTKL
ncbi:trypsin eta-like isoform 1-T1 [Glossina fuscipes fuscipes]